MYHTISQHALLYMVLFRRLELVPVPLCGGATFLLCFQRTTVAEWIFECRGSDLLLRLCWTSRRLFTFSPMLTATTGVLSRVLGCDLVTPVCTWAVRTRSIPHRGTIHSRCFVNPSRPARSSAHQCLDISHLPAFLGVLILLRCPMVVTHCSL